MKYRFVFILLFVFLPPVSYGDGKASQADSELELLVGLDLGFEVLDVADRIYPDHYEKMKKAFEDAYGKKLVELYQQKYSLLAKYEKSSQYVEFKKYIDLIKYEILIQSVESEDNLKRRDHLLEARLSYLGVGIDGVEFTIPYTVDDHPTIHSGSHYWSGAFLESKELEQEQLYSLRDLRKLRDRRSFKPLFQIAFGKLVKHSKTVTEEAKLTLSALAPLWTTDELSLILDQCPRHDSIIILNDSLNLLSISNDAFKHAIEAAWDEHNPYLVEGCNWSKQNDLEAFDGFIWTGVVGGERAFIDPFTDFWQLPSLFPRMAYGIYATFRYGIGGAPDAIAGVWTHGANGLSGEALGGQLFATGMAAFAVRGVVKSGGIRWANKPNATNETLPPGQDFGIYDGGVNTYDPVTGIRGFEAWNMNPGLFGDSFNRTWNPNSPNPSNVALLPRTIQRGTQNATLLQTQPEVALQNPSFGNITLLEQAPYPTNIGTKEFVTAPPQKHTIVTHRDRNGKAFMIEVLSEESSAKDGNQSAFSSIEHGWDEIGNEDQIHPEKDGDDEEALANGNVSQGQGSDIRRGMALLYYVKILEAAQAQDKERKLLALNLMVDIHKMDAVSHLLKMISDDKHLEIRREITTALAKLTHHEEITNPVELAKVVSLEYHSQQEVYQDRIMGGRDHERALRKAKTVQDRFSAIIALLRDKPVSLEGDPIKVSNFKPDELEKAIQNGFLNDVISTLNESNPPKIRAYALRMLKRIGAHAKPAVDALAAIVDNATQDDFWLARECGLALRVIAPDWRPKRPEGLSTVENWTLERISKAFDSLETSSQSDDRFNDVQRALTSSEISPAVAQYAIRRILCLEYHPKILEFIQVTCNNDFDLQEVGIFALEAIKETEQERTFRLHADRSNDPTLLLEKFYEGYANRLLELLRSSKNSNNKIKIIHRFGLVVSHTISISGDLKLAFFVEAFVDGDPQVRNKAIEVMNQDEQRLAMDYEIVRGFDVYFNQTEFLGILYRMFVVLQDAHKNELLCTRILDSKVRPPLRKLYVSVLGDTGSYREVGTLRVLLMEEQGNKPLIKEATDALKKIHKRIQSDPKAQELGIVTQAERTLDAFGYRGFLSRLKGQLKTAPNVIPEIKLPYPERQFVQLLNSMRFRDGGKQWELIHIAIYQPERLQAVGYSPEFNEIRINTIAWLQETDMWAFEEEYPPEVKYFVMRLLDQPENGADMHSMESGEGGAAQSISLTQALTDLKDSKNLLSKVEALRRVEAITPEEIPKLLHALPSFSLGSARMVIGSFSHVIKTHGVEAIAPVILGEMRNMEHRDRHLTALLLVSADEKEKREIVPIVLQSIRDQIEVLCKLAPNGEDAATVREKLGDFQWFDQSNQTEKEEETDFTEDLPHYEGDKIHLENSAIQEFDLLGAYIYTAAIFGEAAQPFLMLMQIPSDYTNESMQKISKQISDEIDRRNRQTSQGTELQVPDLSPKNIIQEVVGLRPYREGSIRIEKEKIGDKMIIHNYGHGGAGLTLSWGSVEEAMRMFDEEFPPTQEPVAVLGGGVIGLTTAYQLLRLGYSVHLYAKDLPPNTTSDIAGGLFAPVSVAQGETKEEKEMFRRMIMRSAFAFDRLGWDSVRRSIVYSPEDEGLAEIREGIEPLHVSVLIPAEVVHLHSPFANATNSADLGRVAENQTFLIDTPRYMQQLLEEVHKEAAGRLTITPMTFETQAQVLALPHHMIMNCLGLAAGKVFNDPKMHPVRGQLIQIKQTNPPIDYMIYGKNMYMFPWQDRIILGGTFDMDQTDLTPNPQTRQRILRDIGKFFGIDQGESMDQSQDNDRPGSVGEYD